MKQSVMKRITVIALCLAMIMTCFAVNQVRAQETEEEIDVTDFSNFRTVTTSDVLEMDLVFDVLPDGYNYYETEYPGTVLRLHYTTDAYEDGNTYEKYCTVYLPYGYDENDKDTKYNVLYFQHGNGGSPNELWDHDMKKLHAKNLIDNLFDPEHGLMDPMIIICPTYFFETDETGYQTPGDNLGGDGRSGEISNYYYKEVVEDLIPQIESQFNVYCEDFSEEGIIASRDHRAWAGYSRGGVCTWYMLHYDLAYFKYWMPMSCDIRKEINGDEAQWQQEDGNEEDYFTQDEAFAYIEYAFTSNPDKDFFIFATAGGKGNGDDRMKEQIPGIYAHKDILSYGLDPEVNNFYFTCSDFNHNDLYMPYSLYNAKDILFQ